MNNIATLPQQGTQTKPIKVFRAFTPRLRVIPLGGNGEIGNLGFNFTKKKTSKNFVITLMFVKRKENVEQAIKKIFKAFTKKERKFHRGVLHAFKETPKTRRKLLKKLNEKDIAIITICLNKKKVHTRLQETKHTLYNYVTNI